MRDGEIAELEAFRDLSRRRKTGIRDGKPGASYRNMLRAGFRESYVAPNYASP